MHVAILKLIEELDQVPGWRDWRKKKLGITIAGEFRNTAYKDGLEDFELPNDLSQKHRVLTLYMNLLDSFFTLQEVEFYFRRYPFHDLPVSHHSHLRYSCEMFFNRIYEFRERMKQYLNELNNHVGDDRLDVGGVVRAFNNEFSEELRARNGIHHHAAFDDIDIDHVYIASILPEEKGWKKEHTHVYRRVAARWVKIVRQKSGRIETYLDAIATASLDHCDFIAKYAGKEVEHEQ